jgi:hypothetical protein
MSAKKVLASLIIVAALSLGSITPSVSGAGVTGKTPVANSNKRRARKPPVETKSGQAPAGATAECRDGSYSYSAHRRGTCSHHGGVKRWL